MKKQKHAAKDTPCKRGDSVKAIADGYNIVPGHSVMARDGRIIPSRIILSDTDVEKIVTRHMAGSSLQVITKILNVLTMLNPAGHLCLRNALIEIVREELELPKGLDVK